MSTIELPADPHIHIHNPVWNALFCEDGKLRTIDFRQLDHLKEFGGLFQAELGNELRKLGVRVRYDEAESAVVVDEIPDEGSRLFSKGRDNTIAKAKVQVETEGLSWDDLDKADKHRRLNRAAGIRLSKNDGLGDNERWEAEALASGWEHTTVLTNEQPAELTREGWIDRTYEFTARHLAKEFETAAVIDLEVMRHWAARSLIGVGSSSPADVNTVIQTLTDRGIEFDGRRSDIVLGIARNKIRVTHTVQVEIEQAVQSLARSMGQDYSRAFSQEAAEAAIQNSSIDYHGKIGRQQKNAAMAMLTGPSLVYVEGVAGTGKTTRVLSPFVQACIADGRTVIGLCQAWRQTDVLEEAGIKQRYALSPFLAGVRNGTIAINSDTVLVLDETAQVGPKTFAELQRLWMRYGVVVRSVGDREQAQSIEAGSAAELIARLDINGLAALPEAALPKILETVRQKTQAQKALATSFRNGGTEGAIAIKRASGTARLVGGDYDQVVARMAHRYLELRDLAVERGYQKGVAMYTLTNNDAGAISAQVRLRLKARGEVEQAETVYQAIDNRGVKFDLPISVGDRHRLFKKVFGTIEGAYQPVGSNGDMVEILGYWDAGIRLRTKFGDANVRWSSLKDYETDRLKMGHGHCMTIDSAQGITASVTLHALPSGTAGETAYKAYVGESRHEELCETLISEAALIAAEQSSRPLGDDREVTEEDLWKRVVKDMSEKPQKSLALDLLNNVLDNREALIEELLSLDRRLQTRSDRDYPAEIFGLVEKVQVRDAVEEQLAALQGAIRTRSDILEGLGDHMATTLRDLRETYHTDDPGPSVEWLQRPGVELAI